VLIIQKSLIVHVLFVRKQERETPFKEKKSAKSKSWLTSFLTVNDARNKTSRLVTIRRTFAGAKLKLEESVEFIQFAQTKILNDDWSTCAVCQFAKRKNLFDRVRVCTITLFKYKPLTYQIIIPTRVNVVFQL